MNTMPDDLSLSRWLDDELQGAELATFEASIHDKAELLARRQNLRNWRATLTSALPAVVEPPYPEFFNHRIEKSILELTSKPVTTRQRGGAWRTWWMPATAMAGMALAFWAGTRAGGVTQRVTQTHPTPPAMIAQAPSVYTPERGVDAEWFSSPDAAATVIVLEGVDAIPDTLDFSETVGLRSSRGSTADLDNPSITETL